MTSPVVNHREQAENRVISQYQNRRVFTLILNAIASQNQEIEDMLQTLYLNLFFENANQFHINKFAEFLNFPDPILTLGRDYEGVDIYANIAKNRGTRLYKNISDWFKRISSAEQVDILEYPFGFIIFAGYSDFDNAGLFSQTEAYKTYLESGGDPSDYTLPQYEILNGLYEEIRDALSSIGGRLTGVGVYRIDQTFRFSDIDDPSSFYRGASFSDATRPNTLNTSRLSDIIMPGSGSVFFQQ